MDAMYLNLMFINPRPPVGAGAKGARCTWPSLTPPLQKNPGSAPDVVRRRLAVMYGLPTLGVSESYLIWRSHSQQVIQLYVLALKMALDADRA